MMNSENEEEFENNKSTFYQDWETYPAFISYFNNEWLPKKENWSKAWRTVSKYLIFKK